ncbi:hypothetical protein F2Q70_00008304 [Brassica cretica]|uniref:Uncharacterized protein n=1 Tax=Brassica cretica TaxID=69181 RepID=A0A8S9M1V9_BRACR|nr:hypothetical protein F2Q70_00008304 [Brassica cretica]
MLQREDEFIHFQSSSMGNLPRSESSTPELFHLLNCCKSGSRVVESIVVSELFLQRFLDLCHL